MVNFYVHMGDHKQKYMCVNCGKQLISHKFPGHCLQLVRIDKDIHACDFSSVGRNTFSQIAYVHLADLSKKNVRGGAQRNVETRKT
jgi:hypothetical protein